MHDDLKQLPTTQIEHAICHLTLPWTVPGNLVLQGDVVHAEIEARGHIIAHGAAEHCRLESELGSVFLLYGSMAYTKITAHLNIFVKHTADSSLAAGQDIIIEHSVVGSVLRAGRKVISESGDASIVGGRVEAGQEVAVSDLGNASGVETLVSVRDPHGQIRFQALYPGVRLKIADQMLTVPMAQGAGVATLCEGRLQILPCENPVVVG